MSSPDQRFDSDHLQPKIVPFDLVSLDTKWYGVPCLPFLLGKAWFWVPGHECSTRI